MAKRRAVSPAHGSVPAKRWPAKDVNTIADTTNTKSQDMLAMGSLLETPSNDDEELQQFRTKVTADRKKLRALLQQQSQQAEEAEARRRNEIAATIFDALKTPKGSTGNDFTTFAGTRIATNAAYKPATEILAASEALLDKYAELGNKITSMANEQAEPRADAWHQELQEAEQKLQLGARVALRNVKKVLGAVVDDDGKDEDLKQHAVQEAEEDEQKLNYELQKSLCYAERGVRRMVKGLPEDDSL